MIKKLILVAVVGGIAVAAFKGTRWASYVRSEVRAMREAAEDQIPPEREIARLRGEVKLLDDDALKVVKRLARLQSDQADLAKRVKALEERKDKTGVKMREREEAVRAAEQKAKSGEANVSVTFGEQTCSLAAGKARLKDAVREYTDLDKELGRARAKTDTQQRIIDKLEAQRQTMNTLKGELDGAIDELETELQAVKLRAMEAQYGVGAVDDSRVAQIKTAVAAQRKKLDVRRRELDLLNESDARPAPVGESVDEIMAPVAGAKPAAPAVPRAE